MIQMSKRKEPADCFNCSASKRHCDRTRHRCHTCSRKSEICHGYPRDLQWLPGVKSRGRDKDKVLSVETLDQNWQSTTPINHSFVFKQGKLRKKRIQKRRKTDPVSPPPCETPPLQIEKGDEESCLDRTTPEVHSDHQTDVDAALSFVRESSTRTGDTFEDFQTILDDSEVVTSPDQALINDPMPLIEVHTAPYWQIDGELPFQLPDSDEKTWWLPKLPASLAPLEFSALLALCKRASSMAAFSSLTMAFARRPRALQFTIDL